MFDTLQPLLLGTATCFELVLLLAVLEPRNWPFVRIPIVAMLAGALLWHGGGFAQCLLRDLPGVWTPRLQFVALFVMIAGLLLMPCGLLHGAWRVWQTGLDHLPTVHVRYGCAYVPLLAIVPLALRISRMNSHDFGAVRFGALEASYFGFSCVVDVIAAFTFVREAKRTVTGQTRSFFLILTAALACVTLLKLVYLLTRVLVGDGERWAFLVMSLAPLLLSFMFTYFVIRYRFLHVLIEQSVAYGAMLGGFVLFHQLAFQGISAAVPESYRLYLVILETALLAMFILAYKPLRQRFAEALRYLVGARVSETRAQLQSLSRELSLRAGQPPRAILEWFVPLLQQALRVDFVSCWLLGDAGEIVLQMGDATHWPDTRSSQLHQRMASAQQAVCSRRVPVSRELLDDLHEGKAALAIRKTRTKVDGLLIVGRRGSNHDLSDEETTAVALLVEQLAITLENGVLHAERLAAERRAMLNEKLSTLGLMAGVVRPFSETSRL